MNTETNVNTEPKRIVIREEEYEEEDVLTETDINDPEDSEVPLWTLTKEQYNVFNMEMQKDEEQEPEVEDDDQVVYEDTQRHYSKEALKKAEAVKDVQAKCGKFSLRKLYDAFLAGAIVNTEGYTKTQ